MSITLSPATGAGTGRARGSKGVLVMGVALAFALIAGIWVTQGSEKYPGAADPRNPGLNGAQALAKVLDHNGVDVEIVRSAADFDAATIDADTTVVVTGTEQLAPSTLRRLRTHASQAARVVMVEPSYAVLKEIDGTVGSLNVGIFEPVDAQCAGGSGAGGGSGGIDLDGLRVQVDAATAYDGEGCFPTKSGVLLRPVDGLMLFGAGEALTNDQITRADNAAVALRLLGHDARLVWYVPDAADAVADDAVTIGTLLPRWIGPGLWLVALSLIALVLWRFRRLGPLSVEPLPVVVRAVETTRSRGRMYRRSGDRAHAARALRRAARADIATHLRLDRSAGVDAVVEATARHLGSPTEPVATLLHDDLTTPTNDPDLVRLAQDLERLRNEVRRHE